MSSYNNVEKIKYVDGADNLVSLKEYIVFEDERAEEKYIVFKFSNNVSQQLLGMEFEVTQYDLDGEMVERSVVVYNKFLSKADTTFVPNAKLKVNYACRRISVRLIKAVFDRFVWKEGDFSDNSYKFEHYVKDRDLQILANQVAEKPKKVKEPKPEKVKKAGKALPFKMKNAFRKNIAKFPGVFNFFACLIVLVAIGLAIYFFPQGATSFTLNNYDLKIINGNEVAIYGYDGDATSLTIPETISSTDNGTAKEYKIIRIYQGAFKNSDIKSVKFTSPNLVIDGGAFEDCKRLTEVSSSNTVGGVLVMADAFKGCSSLKTFDLPQAFLSKNSLNGCTAITSLIFNSTDATKITDLFGGKTPSKLQEFDCNANLPNDFFTGGSDKPGTPPVKEEYDPAREYYYGELTALGISGVEKTDCCEVLNGEIVSVNTSVKEFTFPKGATAIKASEQSKLASVTALTVDSAINITPGFCGAFQNVSTLVLNNPDITVSSLKNLPLLKNLTAPVLGRKLNETVNQFMLENLTITGEEGVTTTYLDGMNYLKEITVESTVPSVGYGAFDSLYALQTLTVPYYDGSLTFAGQFGYNVANNVSILKVIPYAGSIPSNAFGDMWNLSELYIGKGFDYIFPEAIANNPYLNTLVIEGSPEYESWQPIISNCSNLVNVSLSLNNYNTMYCDLNDSYYFTSSLTINADVLDCESFLWDCRNLQYLEINANKVDTTLYQIFSTNSGETYHVSQIVLNGPFDASFTYGVSYDRLS
ncbi:MAG: leucine-rich repeat protein [Clostridia bacterium]|nr:leucine-rich repeat protein [Clostridia bacterium]